MGKGGVMSVSVTSPPWLRVAGHAVRTATTVAGLTLLLGFGALGTVSSPAPAGPDRQIDMSSGPLDVMMEQNRCSFTGFDRDVIPSKAIVRMPDGATELVTFDRGWAVFSGQVAGELVAVCLGPSSTASATARQG